MKKIDYKSYQKPSDFVRFPQGNTKIRIISSGGIVMKHGLKTANAYIPLGDCTETAECKHCASGNEPKTKWIWICYVTSTGEIKLLDVGPQIGDAICKLAQSLEKDPQDFDLIINKSGEGRSSKYTVSKGDENPLTKDELERIKTTKKFLIKKYFPIKSTSEGKTPSDAF